MVTWDNTTTAESIDICSKGWSKIKYCHGDHLLCNGEVNIPSQVDDDIIDVSSENNETLSIEAALEEEPEINRAALQDPGECLSHSSREKYPSQCLIKEL